MISKGILKKFGKINVTDQKGNTTTWVWDYAENKAKYEDAMTKEEWAKSEKAKWENYDRS